MSSSMSMERVRERAYQIWEIEGRPYGRHMDHWLRAEAECQVSEPATPKKRRAAPAGKSTSTPRKDAAKRPAGKAARL